MKNKKDGSNRRVILTGCLVSISIAGPLTALYLLGFQPLGVQSAKNMYVGFIT